MNSFIYILPWTTPAPIGLVIATGFAKLAFVLAPQMASMYDELKHDCDEKGVKSATTSGREYVGLTRDPDKALDFALALMAH